MTIPINLLLKSTLSDTLEECIVHIAYVKNSMFDNDSSNSKLTVEQQKKLLEKIYQTIDILINEIDHGESLSEQSLP